MDAHEHTKLEPPGSFGARGSRIPQLTGVRSSVVQLIRRSRSPTLYHAGKTLHFALMDLRRTRWLLQRKGMIQGYLESHEVRKLELGTGQVATDGWLNSDLDPRFRRVGPPVMFLDVTRRFPFADATLDYIYSEHVIEHISYDDARNKLSECARVLRRNGRIRIATPDLSRLVSLYLDRDRLSAPQAAHVRWMAENVLNDERRATPVFALNTSFREWEHQFLFDEETLRALLIETGFGDVQRFQVNESNDPVLSGRERHGVVMDNETVNDFETMCLEAVKVV